jgi:hypothetical protein
MLKLMDMEVDDGSNWYGHLYKPGYSGAGAPQFGNDVSVMNITVNNA